MYAIAFDMDIATLKKTYGEPYNKANNPPTYLAGCLLCCIILYQSF